MVGRTTLKSLDVPDSVHEAEPQPHKSRLSLEPPLVPADGRKPFELTDEQIHALLELP